LFGHVDHLRPDLLIGDDNGDAVNLLTNHYVHRADGGVRVHADIDNFHADIA
jgi:hypothetical protein